MIKKAIFVALGPAIVIALPAITPGKTWRGAHTNADRTLAI
jgi:hypothetical protein